MPAPNQSNKTSTVINQKRTTRNLTNNKISSSVTTLTKGKSTVAVVRKAPPTSKNENSQDLLNKRKAEKSPFTDKTLKRSAFGDITNAVEDKAVVDKKKVVKKSVAVAACTRPASRKTSLVRTATANATVANIKKQSVPASTTTKLSEKTKENVKKAVVTKKTTLKVIPEDSSSASSSTSCIDSTLKQNLTSLPAKPVTRQSARLSETAVSSSEESSLYVSALEDLNLSDGKQSCSDLKESPKPPPGVADFDKENWEDPNQISHYAFDIFNYLKSREGHYKIDDYIVKQTNLTKFMRSLLVDWMVEVQESFELTHETLYLAVKIVDKYLSKVIIDKNTLQLVGATSLFIASKFDERSPPVLDDIVYVGDQAYTERNVIEAEIKILKTLDFDLGFPLSYRFLRRYARCSRAPMELLTLARFILEYCLMDYFVVTASDSKMAAAALHIARIMEKVGNWDATLEYYSGYKTNDFKDVAIQMNEILHKKPRSSLSNVRNKYSHEIFYAVAKTPLVQNDKLCL